jgi:hypothetical protein
VRLSISRVRAMETSSVTANKPRCTARALGINRK